ncbi:PAS domain-containing protein [Roseibacterium sp. SDUM158017]|uniref:PAS domain-containing protein n=1 Tax=Roseicyclus salinarum TaxID=3036773 RepID=UPI002414DA58|nr:PAS domain-containing protein [Roseibacterium sp. SDUM158017]MDG4648367.1 PAS domain-containing protein [Roseibacterium sp. SDUM158017]
MNGPISNAPAECRLDRIVNDLALRSAIAYWDSLRGKRLVPARMALDPADLRPILRQSAILENPRPGTLRIRLGGARISALMGMEVRGLPLRALFDLADRGRITAEVERALEEPSILLLDVVSPAPRHQGQEVFATQIAILPMTDRDYSISRALYVMGALRGADGTQAEDMAEMPQRWSVARVEHVPVRVGVPVLTPGAADLRRAAPERPQETHAQDADEDAVEARGPMARARFRVIEGGLA